MKKTKLRIVIPTVCITITGVFFALYLFPIYDRNFIANNDNFFFTLETHWSQGNAVALIRHTERCDRSDNTCLDGETGITINGMQEAIKIGSVYSNLLTEQTTIHNSPAKRTMQSAHYMFGALSITKSWLLENCKEHLLDNIFKHKKEGENLILVTHSTCIEALGEKQGSQLFDMSLHGEETYGGSFFIAIDSARKLAHSLGYLDTQSLQNHQFDP
ncbi:MAG: hypothetical protein V7745_05550 [Pseudomonadales bacterium]